MVGTKIVARCPVFIAANATAAPWLPPEAATTPAAGISRESRWLNAPRALNDPACCRNSSLKTRRTSGSPKSAPSTSRTGVRRTNLAMRSAVARIACASSPSTLGVHAIVLHRSIDDIGLEEDPDHLREALVEGRLDTVDLGDERRLAPLLAHARLHRHHDIGAHVQGEKARDTLDRGLRGKEGHHVVSHRLLDTLAHEERLHLDAHEHGDDDQQHADRDAAQGVVYEVSGKPRGEDRDERENQAEECG